MVKNLTAIAGDVGLIPSLGRFPTPLFFPGKAQGQRSLVAYSPWGRQRVGHDLATKQQIKLKKKKKNKHLENSIKDRPRARH